MHLPIDTKYELRLTRSTDSNDNNTFSDMYCVMTLVSADHPELNRTIDISLDPAQETALLQALGAATETERQQVIDSYNFDLATGDWVVQAGTTEPVGRIIAQTDSENRSLVFYATNAQWAPNDALQIWTGPLPDWSGDDILPGLSS